MGLEKKMDGQWTAEGTSGKGQHQIKSKTGRTSLTFFENFAKDNESLNSLKKLSKFQKYFSIALARCQSAGPFGRCVPPSVAKSCSVHPIFKKMAGELGTADPRICSDGA